MKYLLLFASIVSAVGCSVETNYVHNYGNEVKPYEYQLVLEDSFIVISNNGRHVANVPYERSGVLDSIFIADNE
jgi:hypothetical protein